MMAIKVNGTTVIDNNRNIDNIGTLKGLTYPSADGTTGQFLKTDGSGNLAFQTVQTDPTLGTLTKSFTSGETASITLAQAISPAPVVSATKEVPQVGIVSKGAWDVNASASNYDLHNTAYDTTLTPSSVVGEIEDSTLTETFNTQSNLDNNINSFFNNDGTRLYVYGYSPRDMFSYSLSTPYDISTRGATRLQQMTFPAFGGGSFGPRWNNDGTKIYYPDLSGYIYELAVSTAYDLSTIATSSTSTLNLSSYINSPGQSAGIVFKPDGTRLWVINDISPLGIAIECTLSTAWDLSTASYTAQHTLDARSTAIAFADNGSTMYSLDRYTDLIYKFNLSTAYDLSTFDFAGAQYNINLGSGVGDPCNITIDNDDKVLLVANYGNHNTYQYSPSITNSVTLGTGSFASTDVGKRIQGNGGDVTLTSTAGAYDTTGGSAFTDSSAIASGSWSMRGLKSAGDADGIGMTGVDSTTVSSTATFRTGNAIQTFDPSSNISNITDFCMARDGSHFYFTQQNDSLKIFTTLNPFQITNASYHSFVDVSVSGDPWSVEFNSDGSKMYIGSCAGNQDAVRTYTLATPWRPTAGDLTSPDYTFLISSATANSNNSGGEIQFSNFGKAFYYSPYGAANGQAGSDGLILYYTLSTAYDLTTASLTSTQQVKHSGYHSFGVTEDGKWLFRGKYNTPDSWYYELGTPWDPSTIVDTNYMNFTSYSSSSASNQGMIAGHWVGNEWYTMSYNYQSVLAKYAWGPVVTLGSVNTRPTSQYHIAITNSGGQIDTSNWLDINTMVADQAVGSGTVHYAVSTDDRTTWSVIKEGSGVRPIVRDNSGTWQYNTAVTTVGGSVASASYDSVSAQFAANQNAYEVHWGDGGNLLFVQDSAGNQVVKYTASTPYNVTTLTQSQTYSFAGQEIYETTFYISPDGLHFYIAGSQNPGVHEYSLSTAYDLTTVSYVGKYLLAGGTAGTISFKPDGSRIYVGYYNGSVINTWPLTTAWDTSSYGTMQSLTPTETTRSTAIQFNADGTKMFVMDTSVDKIFRFNLSTAYDITTAAKDEEFLYSAQTTQAQGFAFNNDFTKINISGSISGSYSTIYQYSSTQSSYTTSTTWANSTTNDEFYALQEALGETEFNRMDKTQLDAVTDPNHYTLGDTLDLAIALRTDTASASTPTADGVTINYDAASLNQGAVLGTDYDYDFPNSTTVRVTSNAAQNLKIRVV